MVALNVTLSPAQAVLLVVAIEIVGVAFEPTVITILFEVAVEGTAQVRLEVSTTVTASLLANVVDVNVAELFPALLPFTFHW